MCPGFIADSASRPSDNDDIMLREGRVKLLELNGLTFGGNGEVWVKTDSSDAAKLGYEINIHVSIFFAMDCL